MRVDFYLIRNAEKSPESICCQLCAKAYSDGQRVGILTASQQQAEHLDDLLWQTPPQRFIPHGLYGSEDANGAAIIIGGAPAEAKIVINLRDGEQALTLPATRIMEIIADDDTARASARQRYRAYQQAGAELHSHELK